MTAHQDVSDSTARAFWVAAPGHGEIRAVPIGAPGPGDVLVRTRFSGISRGTEALVFQGRVPASEYERMRAPFQEGAFPAPVKYGYASVGVVESGPGDLDGRHVFALYPHQTRYVVPAAAVHVIPDGVPPGRAVLAANLETAITGLWDATPRIGDRVVVIGAGTVGCLVAWLAQRIAGCDVTLVDVDAARAAVAAQLGVHFASPSAVPVDADVVVHASGSPNGLATALGTAGMEAAVVEMSWYGSQDVSLPLGQAFHARRLTIRSSQVGRIPAPQTPRWTSARRMALALRLLVDPVLDALITGESEFEALPSVMAQLARSPAGALCHRIRY